MCFLSPHLIKTTFFVLNTLIDTINFLCGAVICDIMDGRRQWSLPLTRVSIVSSLRLPARYRRPPTH